MGFLILLRIDTPKDTPSNRWLLRDVVGCQFTFVRLSFYVLEYSCAQRCSPFSVQECFKGAGQCC